ncbi:CAF17-like 4Fe-4S cluster assembly/insertion protein YgfZ [Anianabacter salinae]|uniref:CAF17-like 4Fe-4S cluster assembly/insertion protein YgfZ n=1 Tax=Anianabacter salinae TaxID=2851023 RepID=UPI00225DF742|nr:folate-binding protein [Anianabacter salinae]MBV0912687.1 folate-binding protein [Anianabacter salinae]
MPGERDDARTILRISGAERVEFLQNLVTNNLGGLSGGAVYAALLTPQGKYLADFFLVEQGDAILLDVHSDLAPGLAQRMSMYKLRADVSIEDSGLRVLRGIGDAPRGAVADPRHPAMGWRLYGDEGGAEPATDWDAIRVAHCIPETGTELIPNETFILEAGFDRLNGVDFRKGCYVGQEVTARMRHKTELRKGFRTVSIDGEVPLGTEILSDGKAAGTVHTQSGGRAIAYLRFDRIGPAMRAADAAVQAEDTV